MIYTVHGILSPGAEMKALGRELGRVWPEHNVHNYRYGFVGLSGSTQAANIRHAQPLSERLQTGDIVVCHSNGADVSRIAIQEAWKFDRIHNIHWIILNGALKSNVAMPDGLGQVDVFYWPGDYATAVSQWVPCHTWGDMGTVGYQGRDPGITSHNLEEILGTKLVGHFLYLYRRKARELLADYIRENCKRKVEV